MKKAGLLLIVLILLLTGCSGGKSTSEDSKVNKNKDINTGSVEDSNDKTKTQGYTFEHKGTVIAMNEDVTPILDGLGEHTDYFEAESCAFEGLDKIYTYNGFELHTYEIDGADYVASLVFLDDSVATKEGVYLYSKLDDVLTAYGDNYTKNLGLYTYELDKSKISFLIEEDEVVSIEYTAITE